SDPADKKPAPQPRFTAQQVALFEKEALPILQKNCFRCHGGGKKLRGGLRLTSRATILEGGDTGPAVSLDKPGDSLLLKAISYKHGPQMPPPGRLPDKDIATLTRWVKAGLPWTPGADVAVVRKPRGGKVTEESRNYWAYRPLRRPPVPRVMNTAWVRNPVDAF